MAIEILDKGACKAAGFITTDPVTPTIRVQGIQRVLLTGVSGRMQVELTEPIGATELLCLGSVQTAVGATDDREVMFFQPDPVANPALIEINTLLDSGLAPMGCWFAFFRMEGGVPEIVPAPPP